MNIGKRIKNIRMSKEITASQLAKNAFISQSYLSDIESGRTAPSLDKLFTICEALDISLSEFFGDVPELPVDIIRLVNNAQKLEEEEIKLLSSFIELIVKRSKRK